MAVRRLGSVAVVVVIALAPAPARAHVFPDHSEPRVGRTVPAAPSAVRIWFDGELEPVFSTMRVENAGRQRVDRNDAHVDPSDGRLLEVSLAPSLPGGKYHVFWSVVARDGHRTEGDFSFRVK